MDPFHHLGEFRPFLPIHDVLLFLGERHLVRRPGIHAAAPVLEPGLDGSVLVNRNPVGVRELIAVAGQAG